MQIRLAASMQHDSILDGEGIRSIIWTQGCPHNCLGCHNPETHDFNGGLLVDVEEIKRDIDLLEGQDGITFSGGDPMCQPEACAELAKYSQKKGLNIWCYTGYTYEDLLLMSETNKNIMIFLKQIDVLVDSKFMLELKSMDLKFRGSRNQRVIDVKKSLETNKLVTIPEYMEDIQRKMKHTKEPYIFI